MTCFYNGHNAIPYHGSCKPTTDSRRGEIVSLYGSQRAISLISTIIIRSIVVVLLLLGAVAARAETSQQPTSGGGAKTCRTSAFARADGCAEAAPYNAAAPAVSFLDPNLFAGGLVFQTPGMKRDGVAKVTWNVPGRDFAVGVAPGRYCDGPYVSPAHPAKPCSTTPGLGATLIDARLYDWIADPAKVCARARMKTYEDGTASVFCDVADGGLQINGFDFTPNGLCVTLRLEATAEAAGVGTVRFTNNRFVQPATGHACAGKRYDPLGVLTTAPFFMHPNLAHRWDFVVENNWFDPQTSKTHAGQGIGMIDVASAGSATFRYNYLGDMASRSVNAKVCTGLDFEFNFTPSMGYWPNDVHGELFLATIDFYNGVNYCKTDESGAVRVQHFKVVNNFAVSQYGISGSTFTAVILVNLSGASMPNIMIEQTAIDLNVFVTNLLRPNHAYVMLAASPAALQVDAFAVKGQYTTGDIVALENGCRESPTLRLYDVSGSDAETKIQVEAWTGGHCETRPDLNPYYPTLCKTCQRPASGLKIKFKGTYANYNSGNGLIGILIGRNSGAVTHLDFSASHNALDALGANGRDFIVNTLSGALCATRITAEGNFDLETGTNIAFPSNRLKC